MAMYRYSVKNETVQGCVLDDCIVNAQRQIQEHYGFDCDILVWQDDTISKTIAEVVA